MSNNLSASFPEIWAKEQQTVFYKKNLAMEFADTSFNAEMAYGATLDRVYRSQLVAQAYVRGSEISIDDLTDTKEQLNVNKSFATGFYVDDFDKIQSRYDIAMNYGKDAGEALANQVDADVFGEVINADSTLSDTTISTSTVLGMFASAAKELSKNNVTSRDRVAAVSPEVASVLTQYLASKNTMLGDDSTKEGYFGKFYGFKVYESNQLTNKVVLALATLPTNGDTVVIDGITFTFVSTIGTTAGNVLIGANVDATRANLAALIAAPSTTTANGVALSTANARKVANTWVGSNDNTANTLTVYCKGVGVAVCSETLTDGTDGFSSITQLNVFGVAKKCTTLVMQKSPVVQLKEVPNKLGKNALNGVLYGVKTFSDNAKQMVSAPVVATSFTA